MIHKKFLLSLLSVALLFGTAGAAVLGDDEAEIKRQSYSYPLKACVVAGKEFSREVQPHSFLVEGQLVRTCCEKCEKTVREDPKEYLAKIEKAIIAEQVERYPFTKCLVSDEALDSMGGPLDIVHASRLVRLCCKGCTKAFNKKPEIFIAKIDEAMKAAQRETYPFKTCIVSDEALDSMGGPLDKLYGTTLVRLCCKSCVKRFNKKPGVFLADLAAARAAAKK